MSVAPTYPAVPKNAYHRSTLVYTGSPSWPHAYFHAFFHLVVVYLDTRRREIMDPGAPGCYEIAIYAHIQCCFPYRYGGIFRIGDVVTEQGCARYLHQEQGSCFMATRQPVAFELEIPFHIDVDRPTTDFVFHNAERVYPDAIGQHYTAYFAVPDIEQPAISIGEQAQRVERISFHPYIFPMPHQLKCTVGFIAVGRNIAAPFDVEGGPVIAKSTVAAQGYARDTDKRADPRAIGR